MASPDTDRDYGAALGRLTEIARKRLPAPRPSPDPRQQESFEAVRAKLGLGGGLARHEGARRVARLPLALAGAGIAAAAAAAIVLAPRAAPLAVAIESPGAPRAALAVDEVVAAPAAAEAALVFSDGTAVTLEKAARGRVARLTNRGARVRLESGRARVKVVPRRGGEWLFDAGPCEVRVTGTRFDLSWSDAARRLDIALETGSVIVKSPLTPEGMGVTAGERLIVDLRKGTVRRLGAPASAPAAGVTPSASQIARPAEDPVAGDRAAVPAEAPAPVPAPAAPAPVPATRGDRPSAPAPAHQPPLAPRRDGRRPGSWAALVTAGEFATVLAEARRDGVDQVLGRSSGADVMALADAARFTGEVGLARRAFLAARMRFAGTAQAHRAAFQLGRLAEDADGDLGKALEWYDIYLASGPRGTHVEEALGRKMTATLRLFGRASARPLAEQYLERFSQGGYARAARAIIAGGSP
jgi:hypothetical protein